MTPSNKSLNLIVSIVLAVTIGFPGPIFSQQGSAPAAVISQNSSLISLNLKEVNIEDALKIIAEASGLNVILDKDVKAKVNITLKDVTWQTALDNILKTNELTYRIQGNIIRIMTLATLQKEDETLPLVTKIIALSFAKADKINDSVKDMLSKRGKIQINTATNSLIITDTPDTVQRIEEVVAKLDSRTPQVLIETLIVSVKLTDKFYSGLDYTVTNKDQPLIHFDQVLKTGSSVFDMYYGKTILPGWNISNFRMNFLASDERVNILAEPKVLTLDNNKAEIQIIEQVPYTMVSTSTQSANTVTSTQFKEAGIKLSLTPQITKDKFISLVVSGEQSFRSGYAGTTQEPVIDSRKVDTNFMLKDGDTAVIGGLRKKDFTNNITKVPVLGDIPFIGKLFFSKIQKDCVETELLIFITVHIVDDTAITKTEKRNFKDATDDLAGLDSKKKRILNNLREKAIYRAFIRASKYTAK